MRMLPASRRGELVTPTGRIVTRSVRGNAEKVNRTVTLVKDAGRFIEATEPVRQSNGEWLINVRYLDGPLPAVRPSALPTGGSRRRFFTVRRVATASAIAITLAVASAATLWVISNIGKILVTAAIAMIVLFLIQRLFRHDAKCPGLHCPGCKH